MSRSRTAFLSGTITDNPLAVGGTTLNSAGLASLPAIASPDIAVLVLDPTGSAGAPEVIYVTAHTGAATSATISRGKEGSSAREHASGISWVHGPTLYDFKGWRLEGSQLTEATMTGTSAADLLTVSGLLIPVTQSIHITGQFRKSAGAAGICGLGLKLNTTVVGEAHTGGTANGVAYTVTTNEAESGAFVIDIAPRQANYLRAATGYFSLWGAAGGSLASVMQPVYTADMPNATITDIIIRGISGNGAITLAVDSVYVHVLDE
jgi:hypothetical protein